MCVPTIHFGDTKKSHRSRQSAIPLNVNKVTASPGDLNWSSESSLEGLGLVWADLLEGSLEGLGWGVLMSLFADMGGGVFFPPGLGSSVL